METKEKSRIADIVFVILLAGVVCMHLSRIRLGNVDIDEAFYLTVPYRLAQGEGLLADEWHVSQLVGFLLYPFVKCYLLIQGIRKAFTLHQDMYICMSDGKCNGFLCATAKEK